MEEAREVPWQRSLGMRLVRAVCRGEATPAMFFEFAAEMERRGERESALEVQRIGESRVDSVRRRDSA